jgi:hypothetical protein
MIACLPKLFNKIHFLFQSIKQSVLTKEELIHKIIASHSDIADRSKQVVSCQKPSHIFQNSMLSLNHSDFCLQEKLKSS